MQVAAMPTRKSPQFCPQIHPSRRLKEATPFFQQLTGDGGSERNLLAPGPGYRNSKPWYADVDVSIP